MIPFSPTFKPISAQPKGNTHQLLESLGKKCDYEYVEGPFRSRGRSFAHRATNFLKMPLPHLFGPLFQSSSRSLFSCPQAVFTPVFPSTFLICLTMSLVCKTIFIVASSFPSHQQPVITSQAQAQNRAFNMWQGRLQKLRFDFLCSTRRIKCHLFDLTVASLHSSLIHNSFLPFLTVPCRIPSAPAKLEVLLFSYVAPDFPTC